MVDKVLGHRRRPHRGLEFLTHWTGADEDTVAWEPVGSFIHGCPEPWLQYCSEAGLTMDLREILESRGKPWDDWLASGGDD